MTLLPLGEPRLVDPEQPHTYGEEVPPPDSHTLLRKEAELVGEHLDRAIRTGIYCVYRPDSRITASG